MNPVKPCAISVGIAVTTVAFDPGADITAEAGVSGIDVSERVEGNKMGRSLVERNKWEVGWSRVQGVAAPLSREL
jgi:hypothetical protein